MTDDNHFVRRAKSSRCMWQFVGELLEGEKLPESLDEDLRALEQGLAVVIHADEMRELVDDVEICGGDGIAQMTEEWRRRLI